MSGAEGAPLILVVDDQNSNLQVIGEILDRAGYRVMPARNGQQAIARASLRRPDLVLLDMRLPDVDGIELCGRLRELAGLEALPILMVTAVNDRAALVRSFAAGAVDYLTKPFVVEELVARVRTHLELKGARDRLAAMVRDREDVTDIVAHDLKNPLTCILFAAKSLQRAGLSETDTRAAVEVEECAIEALQYVQRFLARGAARERLRQFATASVQLGDIALDAARLQRLAAHERGVTLRVLGDATVLADGHALRNVIQNLVSNAVRHSPAGEVVDIEISASSRPGFARCMVVDRGAGVSAEMEPRLFQRGAPRPVSEPSGFSSGYGLAIARHDIVQMGGHLWYERPTAGGSCFAFELPQRAEAAQSAPA